MCIATHTIMTQGPIGNKNFAAQISVPRGSTPLPTTNRKVISRPASAADGSKIRSRFLNRIGITSRSTQRGKRVAASCNPSSSSSSSCPPSCNRNTICSSSELLKKDHGKPDESLGPDSLSQASFSPSSLNSLNNYMNRRQLASAPKSTAPPCKVVSFANAVEVIPIPSHRDYSDRIKNTFWTNKTEMQHMYARNVLEYTAENWDYRQVLEEDQFYRVVAAAAAAGGGGGSGSTELVLIHPIHFHVQRQQQQQRQEQQNLRLRSFCAVMSAQQKHH